MAAGASQVGIKEVANNGVVDLVITGTNKADVIGISDNGTGAAGNITVSLGGGQTYVSQSAITVIEVQGKGGNDQVNYALDGNLIAARTVLVDLGAGQRPVHRQPERGRRRPDRARPGSLRRRGQRPVDDQPVRHGPVRERLPLSRRRGRQRHPDLQRDRGPSRRAPPSSPASPAGPATTRSSPPITGIIAGNYIYNLTIDGGAGNDNISDDVHVLAGSPGTVGTDATTPAAVMGGAGTTDPLRRHG